jgi:hypothetical protein
VAPELRCQGQPSRRPQASHWTTSSREQRSRGEMCQSIPSEGMDRAAVVVQAGAVIPRYGLVAGATMTALVAVVLASVPVTWLEGMLDTAGAEATTFLVRRYAASATAALAVVTIGIVRCADPRRAALLGLGTWFGVQAVTAWWGVISGSVGGFAWAAVVADPLLAAAFLILSRRSPSSAHPATGPELSRRDTGGDRRS